MKSRDRSRSTISVVLPVFNEEQILHQLIGQISNTLNNSGVCWNIVLVNDGSTDSSGQIMDELAHQDSRIHVLHLARNFGHQSAVHAGVCFASGDAVVVMDSDGQDSPDAISTMIDHWFNGDDVVYAVRFGRKESLPKRFLFNAFYRVLSAVASIKIPKDAGNFGLIDRAVVNQIRLLSENDRYFPGLRCWVGYRQRALLVERLARHDDQPRVRLKGLISLAKTALFSFSRVPLHVFYVLAASSASVSVGCIAFAIFHKIFTGLAIPGWASTTSAIAFFGAIQSLGIAILGEYIARIYDQVRNRPMYIVARSVNAQLQGTDERSGHHEVESDLLQQIENLKRELGELNVCMGNFVKIDSSSWGIETKVGP
jgi:glycosyltransferase involved in cell wall biosynthesis